MSFWENFLLAFLYVINLVLVGASIIIPISLAITVSPWIALSIFVTLPLAFAIGDFLLFGGWW